VSDPWDGPPPAAQPRPADGTTAGVLVWDNQTGQPAYIRVEDFEEALSSGRYRAYDQSVVRTQSDGATQADAPAVGRAHTAAGRGFVPVSDVADQEFVDRRRGEFDNWRDKAFTFAEGVVNNLTLGTVKERGEAADLRRDVNSSEAFMGQMTGVAASLLNPASAAGNVMRIAPAARVAVGGEKAGRAVAKAVFGEVKAGERALTAVGRRAVSEATSNAAMAGAAALGNQVSDAIIEDKPFAAEHVASEMWKGGVLGGAFGAGGELFGRARSAIKARDAIRSQGGVMDAASEA
jgi:hypothetical protein